MAKDILDPILRVIAEHACRALVLTAADLIDRGQFADLPGVFSAKALLVRPNGATLTGCDAIITSYTTRPAGRISRHLILGTHFSEVSAQKAVAATRFSYGAAASPMRLDRSDGQRVDSKSSAASTSPLGSCECRFSLQADAYLR
ncbi:nuclear transport factor 2 family protein [Paraburkholderia sp. UCT2]|uniref:nuclear transport factor 2 family protein n=1 Tax=Paraburkholderia sp. UCT2 TaxID=2615208 RepID=UPI001654EF30|nr:nuclear transport factor 2 family protein [Paraburkholderia sp. UCT2]MBC8729912.1 hypothetical protein [Paraburkholderia sp. UCT2]